jgi:hypothetical protein
MTHKGCPPGDIPGGYFYGKEGRKIFTDFLFVNRISKKRLKIAVCTNPQIKLK